MPLTRTAALRLPLPATLVAWALPEPVVAVFRGSVAREARVALVRNGAEAQEILRSGSSLCMIVPVLRDRFDPFWTDYTVLRERFPNIPVIAVAMPGVSSMQAAVRLSQLGVSDLLDANDGLRADDIRTSLSKAYSDATAQRILTAVEQEFSLRGNACPTDLTTILKRALRHAHTHLPASKVAALMQMHERTLRKFCEARQLPSPQLIAGWARLLLSALYIDERGRTFASIADVLGYPTPGALRKQIVRYTARSPKQLRQEGAMCIVAQLLHQQILRPDAPQTPTHDERPRLVLLKSSEGAA